MEVEKKRSEWVGFLPFLLSNTLITLLSMITSVGTPLITDTFGLTSQQAPWIITLNTMSAAILAPLLGWVGDKKGVKVQLSTGIIFTVIAHFICAFAPNFALFCVGRFLAGIGLAAAYPSCMNYISTYFPNEKKVGAFAIMGACTSFGSGFGPMIVGVCLSVCTWRQLFLYSEVICLALLAMVLLTKVPTGTNGEIRRLDGFGMITLFIGIGALLSLLTLSQQLGWTHPLNLVLMLLSIVFLFLFVWHESGCDHALIDVSLFRTKRFVIPAMIGLFCYAIKAYCCTAIPYYFTSGLGLDSSMTGNWLAVFFVSAFPLSFLVGKLNRRFDTQKLAICGALAWCIGMLIFVLATPAMPMWIMFAAAVIPSIGIALLAGMPNACALRGMPPERSGSTSSTLSLMSNLGSSLVSALVIPYLSVFGRAADGTSNYVASFPKVAMIMLALMLGCLVLTFFFPKDKAEN